MFNVYIKRAAEIYGVTYTRPIYEKAIEVLHDEQARWNGIAYLTLIGTVNSLDNIVLII